MTAKAYTTAELRDRLRGLVDEVSYVTTLARIVAVRQDTLAKFLHGTTGVPTPLMPFLGVKFDEALARYVEVAPASKTIAVVNRGLADEVRRLSAELKSARIMIAHSHTRLAVVGKSFEQTPLVRRAVLAAGGVRAFAQQALVSTGTVEQVLGGKREPSRRLVEAAQAALARASRKAA